VTRRKASGLYKLAPVTSGGSISEELADSENQGEGRPEKVDVKRSVGEKYSV